jgi:exopolysaccharide biosynthesis protein
MNHVKNIYNSLLIAFILINFYMIVRDVVNYNSYMNYLNEQSEKYYSVPTDTEKTYVNYNFNDSTIMYITKMY